MELSLLFAGWVIFFTYGLSEHLSYENDVKFIYSTRTFPLKASSKRKRSPRLCRGLAVVSERQPKICSCSSVSTLMALQQRQLR